MKVAMYDAEFAEGLSIAPNPWLMKASSYHKQVGHNVSLVDNLTIFENYDMIYIVKESSVTKLPNPEILLRKGTRLMSSMFKDFENYYEPGLQIKKARPDYFLYSFEFESELTKSSYISIMHEGSLIETQDQFQNNRELSISVLLDDIWDSPHLEEALDQIKNYPKLVFYKPVKIIFLKNSNLIKKFINLRLLNHSFETEKLNSLEQLESAIKIINEMKKIRTFSYGELVYSSVKENSKELILEVIQAVHLANKEKIKLRIEMTDNSLYLFSAYKQKQSLFDFLIMTQYEGEAKEILTSTNIKNNKIIKIVKELSKDSLIAEFGFTEYGGRLSQSYYLI